MDNTEKMLAALHQATNTQDPKEVKKITENTLREIRENKENPKKSSRLKKQEVLPVSSPPKQNGRSSTTSAEAFDKWQRENEK